MLICLKNNRGQGIAIQYVLTFFLVVGVVSAMSVYVRRAVQGRIVDSVNFLGETVKEAYLDPRANIAGNTFLIQYEPYYTNTEVFRDTSRTQVRQHLPSSPAASGIFQLDYDETQNAQSTSSQKSPRQAD